MSARSSICNKLKEYFKVNEVLRFVPKEIEIIDVIEKTFSLFKIVKIKEGG